jgi:hypothetical protein
MGTENAKASFAVEIRDEGSAAAESMANSLTRLKASLGEQVKALRTMQDRMRQMRENGIKTGAAFDTLKAQVAAQKQVVGATRERYTQLRDALAETKRKATELKAAMQVRAAKQFEQFEKNVGSLKNSTASTLPRLQQFQHYLASLGPWGNRAAIALGGLVRVANIAGIAIAAVGVAMIAAIAVIGRYALAVAGARREEQLHFEGLARWRRMQGVVMAGATELQSAIDRVADSTALGRDQITGFATSIARAGIRGQALNDILETTAMVSSAAGDEAANTFRSQAVGAARAGASIKGLVAVWRRQFGGIAAAQSLSFGRQLTRLRENVAGLFSGLKIDALLHVFRNVTSLFSQTTQTGRSLRQMITALGRVFIHDLVGDVGASSTSLRDFFLDIVIAAQRMAIGFLQFRRSVLGSHSALAQMGGLVGAAITSFRLLQAGIAAIANFDWSSIGRNIVDGIASGIQSAWDGLAGTMRGLASGLPRLLAQQLGIHSPSRVFAQLGIQIPRGLAVGIERARPEAEHAMAVAIPDEPAAPTPARASSRTTVVHSAPVFHVQITGGNAAEIVDELKSRVREIIGDTFDGLAIHLGAEVPT